VWVEGGEVRMRVVDDGLADEAAVSARVRTPDGTIESVTLSRVSGSVFEGEVVGSGPGAYWVAVTVDDGSGGRRTVSSGAVSSYQPEFAFREPDPTLAADLAVSSGGRVGPDPAAVWDEAPVNGRSTTPIWPWLVMLALAGFAADVALRRLSFSGSGAEAGIGSGASTTAPFPAPGPSGLSDTAGAAVMTDTRVETASDSETLQRLMRRKRR
jgi:hypothetical protein